MKNLFTTSVICIAFICLLNTACNQNSPNADTVPSDTGDYNSQSAKGAMNSGSVNAKENIENNNVEPFTTDSIQNVSPGPQ